MHLSHILNELAEDRAGYFNAVAPPLIQASNFAFTNFEDLREAFADEFTGAYLYSKSRNPTVDILRQKLAALEGAEDALALNSGSSAIYAAVVPFLKTGDHVVAVRNPYTWAWKLFDRILPRFGVETTYVDGTDVANFEAALRPNTALMYLESPNTLTYELQDLRAVANLARPRGIRTVVDNSYCSPLYQRPHALGIDLCLHSAAKYFGGHSDVIAGVVTGSEADIRHIFAHEFSNAGLTIPPFHAWLILRGLRTLDLRLRRSSETALKLVEFLKTRPEIERVLYPFDPDFSQYELARRQMTGAGGLFTVVLKPTTYAQIERFTFALKHFLVAVSWGGHESLVLPMAAGLNPAAFDPATERHRMIRFYAGLEDADFLLDDLRQALPLLAE
jgi:cystathionine beta-lyase/cystathionine gamma-synthase